jgi:hypothetical protein
MSVGMNAAQARNKAQQDMKIYNEVQTIMTEIMTQSLAGKYTATVSDGTDMTEATPTVVITGTVANPTVGVGQTLIIDTQVITLGTTGTNLNSIIADINDAGINVVASKDSSNHLVLTITAVASTTWEYDIDATGTANTAVGITPGLYQYATPESVDFWSAWQGTTTDRGRVVQMDTVIKHFSTLGFRVERTTNTSTSKTFQWSIYW